MRHGLVAFGITTAVLVPAALERLTAGSVQVGKLAAPGARTVVLGGATIDVALDRSIVDPGGQVHLRLTAREAGAREVKLAVLVMEAVGTGGDRVETPPQRIARELVTFPAGAAGVERTLAFRLRGGRDIGMDGVASLGRYSILVMPPAAADQLEKLRRRAVRVDDPMEDPDGRYGVWSGAYYAIGRDDIDLDEDPSEPAEKAIAAIVGTPGQTARLEVMTRPAGARIALRAPETAAIGQPFTVAVTVKNPGKQALRGVGVRLMTPPLYSLEYRGLDPEQVTFEPEGRTIDLGPNERAQVEFTVTARAAGTAGMYAVTSCDDAGDWNACQVVLDGALDATDIVAPAEAMTTTTTIAAAPAAASDVVTR